MVSGTEGRKTGPGKLVSIGRAGSKQDLLVMVLNNHQESLRIAYHSEDDLLSIKCQAFIVS